MKTAASESDKIAMVLIYYNIFILLLFIYLFVY